MGKTSKPVHLLIDQSILAAAPEQWDALIAQGHTIQLLQITENSVIVAPYAMRMTAAMVKDLPKAIELLIKGARALQHSPAGNEDWKKGKVKGGVQNKGKAKRQNSKVKAQDDDSNEHGATERTGSTEGREEVPVGTSSDTPGNG